MSGDDFSRLDATAQAELVRNGEVQPIDLVDAAIDRIERLDPQVNAVIMPRFEAARAEASGDLPDGPFRGVPITMKDLWPSMAGEPWHQGVAALKNANYVADVDSDLVTRYREAGFVIVGRTNSAELGLSASTETDAYGSTHNPWNLDYGAGGSSGGAGASVAAGMTAVANASDGGGSIRIPAAHNGLVGLKPSRGRMPMGPHQEEWGNSVQHVVCHTMRDAANVLDVTAIPTLGDGVVAPALPDSAASFLAQHPGTLRIGVSTQARPGVDVHADNAAATNAIGELLVSLGHHVEFNTGPAALVEERPPSAGLLASASTRGRLNEIAEIIGRPLVEGDVEPGTWFMAAMADGASAQDLNAAQSEQHHFRRRMASWWSDGWDLLVTPTTAQPPPRLGEMRATADNPFAAQIGSIPYAVFNAPFNSTGQPALSVPAGRTAAGLPLGVQLVAAYGREDQLISVGAQLEEALDWASTRSPLHP